MSSATLDRPRNRKRESPPPASDPVSAYAEAVRSGAIVAGRAVRLAAKRHFADLKRQRTEAFPYYFDEVASQHIIDFFPTFLTLESGEPFHLPLWLQFSYGSIFGWKCWGGNRTHRLSPELLERTGSRRYRHGFFETSKGSGKTPSAGGVGLYGLAFDDEAYAQIYSTGFDRGQASIILEDAIRMAKASPDLEEILKIDKYNIAHAGSGSFFRAMSSQHQSKSGPRPHYVLSDEIHEQRDGTVVGKAESGFKFRKQPLGLKYTNSGSDKTSYCWQLHQKSLDVLEGAHVDEQWFAYVCHLDSCTQCFDAGYRQPRDGCDQCDNWLDPKVWPKIAPALGIVIQPKYLQDAIDAALSIPSEYALKRRLNFCIWTETHTIWIRPDDWKACEVASVGDNLEGVRAAAFDMSEKLDLTACVVGIKTPAPLSEPKQTVEITDMDGDQEVKKLFDLNFYVDLISYFWLPEETLRERVAKERIPLDLWARTPSADDPYLRTTPGPVIDHDLVFEQFRDEIAAKYKPQRIGYDGHNATQFAIALRDKAKFEIAEIPQGRKLSESFKLFEALVRLKRIRHNGNPVMAWCVGNAEPKRDRYENLWVEKPSQTKRIDGLIAAVMVLSQLMVLTPAVVAAPRVSVVTW